MIWGAIAVGGALGAIARHALNTFVHRGALSATFPYGIFATNVLGSAVIGLLAGLLAGSRVTMSAEMRAFVFVGLLGGFTTFSSFSLDTLTLMRGGYHAQALVNVAGQVVLSLAAVAAGFRLGTAL